MPLKLCLVPSKTGSKTLFIQKSVYWSVTVATVFCTDPRNSFYLNYSSKYTCIVLYRLSNMYFVSHVFCMHSPSILCVLLCVHNSYAVCVCIRSFVYCLTILNMLARSNYTPFISFHPVMFFVFQLKCLYIWSALNQPPYFA